MSASGRRGGISSVGATSIRFDDDYFGWRYPMDASSGFRSPGSCACCAPVASSPRPAASVTVGCIGRRWDVDISVSGLLAGFGDQTRPL